MNAFSDSQLNSNSKVIPNVPQCGPGQHWSYYLNKCVDVCSSGYHNDSITGACVMNGGMGLQEYVVKILHNLIWMV